VAVVAKRHLFAANQHPNRAVRLSQHQNHAVRQSLWPSLADAKLKLHQSLIAVAVAKL
jgi:hypothetical protein